MSETILKLTPIQAKILFFTIDGQADAGACEGGNTKQEARAFQQITLKMLAQKEKWLHTKLQEG